MFKATVFVCFLYCIIGVHAQKKRQDTVLLPTTEIISSQMHAKGIQCINIDSNMLQKNAGHSLGQLLQTNTSLYLKNYGTQQLSTISIRGGSAQQTQIFWSGFNTNNAMLGQLDLATIPVSTIQQAQLILGAQSTAYGSGAIGGIISINDNKIFKHQANEIEFNSTIGSFQNYSSSFKLKLSGKKISNQFSIYYHNSKNDFEFTNRLRPEEGLQKMQHGENLFYGITNNLQAKLNDKNFLNFNVWLHQQNRNISPSLLEQNASAQQVDAFFKNNIAWLHFFSKTKLMLSSALMQDVLNYQNGFVSNSRVLSWMNFASFETRFDHGLIWHSKIQYNTITAHFNQYEKTKTPLHQYQFTSSIEKVFAEKINTSLAFRYEIQNDKHTPLIVQAGADYHVTKNFVLKLNAGNTYRWPTLNDLYWREGGNINLKPEQGLQSEAGILYQVEHKNFKAKINSTAFYRQINDWIIWLPGPNFWRPENIAKVESKGLENRMNVSYQIKDFSIQFNFNYDHTVSQNKKRKFENDATYNKQLIYTPIQQALAGLHLQFQNTRLSFNRKFNGYHYTVADNSQYLEGFWVSTVELGQMVKIKKTDVLLNLNINNLENKNFEYIAFYPSMGINYKISITIKIK